MVRIWIYCILIAWLWRVSQKSVVKFNAKNFGLISNRDGTCLGEEELMMGAEMRTLIMEKF